MRPIQIFATKKYRQMEALIQGKCTRCHTFRFEKPQPPATRDSGYQGGRHRGTHFLSTILEFASRPS